MTKRGELTAAVRKVVEQYPATAEAPGPWCRVATYDASGEAGDDNSAKVAFGRASANRAYVRRAFPGIETSTYFDRDSQEHRIMVRHLGEHAAATLDPEVVVEPEYLAGQ